MAKKQKPVEEEQPNAPREEGSDAPKEEVPLPKASKKAPSKKENEEATARIEQSLENSAPAGSTHGAGRGARNAGVANSDVEGAQVGVPVGAPFGSEAITPSSKEEGQNPTTKITKKMQQEDSQVRRSGSADTLLTERKAAVKAALDAQPKVRMMVPFGIGEKSPAYQEVQINGYTMYIQKGVFMDLPETVAKLLADSQRLTLEAGQEFLIDRDPRIREALG